MKTLNLLATRHVNPSLLRFLYILLALLAAALAAGAPDGYGGGGSY